MEAPILENPELKFDLAAGATAGECPPTYA